MKVFFASLLVLATAADAAAQRPIHPRWSADGCHIVYAVMENGSTDIFIREMHNGSERNLTSDGAFDSNPAFSPDGQTVVYGRAINGTWDIWTQSLRTGELHQLTHTAEREMHTGWSPDGKWISFVRFVTEDNTELFLRDVATGEERQLTHTTEKEFHPKWSADSRFLVYDRTDDETALLYRITIDAPGHEPVALLPHGASGVTPSVSPDGRTVAYTQRSSSDEPQKVMLLDVASRRIRPAESSHPGGAPVFSPDGRSLLFHVYGVDGTDSFLVQHDIATGRERLIRVGSKM